MVGRSRYIAKVGLREALEISLRLFLEFSDIASKAAVEASNSVVIFVIADLGSATRAASAQPNHQGCPRELHSSTVVLFVVNSSVNMSLGVYISSRFQFLDLWAHVPFWKVDLVAAASRRQSLYSRYWTKPPAGRRRYQTEMRR
jgi:hypothetical protein